jgi:putative transposase
MGFIDTRRAEGHAVESICRVLREQGCQVAARTYRAWRTRPPAARTVSDAHVVDAAPGPSVSTVAADSPPRACTGGGR